MRTTVSAKRNNLISTYCFKVAMGHDLGFKGMLFTPIVFFFVRWLKMLQYIITTNVPATRFELTTT